MRRRRALWHLEEDLRDHIEREMGENIERGMAPEEARAAALRKFGNVARVMEDTRAVWTWMWLEQLLQDIRYGLRGLHRNPGFAAVVVLTLALGIGMNTAVFTLVNAILVKPLAYPNADRLLWLTDYQRVFKVDWVTGADYVDWRTQADTFESLTAYDYQDRTIATPKRAEQHRVAEVTPEFWELAGVRPALGRLFTSQDRAVVVLSDRLFEQEFHSDPGVIGRQITVGGVPPAWRASTATIIGVLPKGFRFLLPLAPNLFGNGQVDTGSPIEAFLPNPIGWEHAARGPGNPMLPGIVGKLKPGVSIERARSELEAIQARLAREHPRQGYDHMTLWVAPLREKLVQDARPALLVLLAAVGFVLLIACANIANLLLAHGAARQKELAIRAAIGAGRARVLRQFLGENLALASLGGAVGLLLARIALPVMVRLAPASLPRLSDATMDGRVLLFALAASLVTGLIFGASTAIFLRGLRAYDVLKQGGRTSSASPAGLPLRRVLVSADLALAIVLLTGAGLMIKSFWRMNELPPGFAPERILALNLSLSGPRYQGAAQQRRYVEEALQRVEATPGVRAAGIIVGFAQGWMQPVHGPPFPANRAPSVKFYAVSSDIGRALGMRLVRGRWLADQEPQPTVLINQSFARALFGKADPLGQPVYVPADPGQSNTALVAGVVGDLKYSRSDVDPEPEVYVPYQLLHSVTFMVRTASDAAPMAATLQKLVADIDRTQPVYEVKTLEQALAQSVAPLRFNLYLLGIFAGSALLLALVGIYGVIAYAVAQRTHEIAVRMALGAQRGQVVRLVLREGMTLAAVGIAAGLAAALGLTRLMSSLLYDVKPSDPLTYAVVTVALAVTALAACCKPALRAACVDSATALREQ